MATEHFCLRWNNHQSTLISVFDNLLESGTLVDCTLAADGRYLKAHKVVLSACSPYLGMLLSQHYDKHPIIILKDVKYEELKAMLDYMYRGEVNISQEQLSTFLKAAETLQIKGLTDTGGDESNGAQTNRPPSSNSSTSLPNEDPQSPAEGRNSPTTQRKRKRIKLSDESVENESQVKVVSSDGSDRSVRESVSISGMPSNPLNALKNVSFGSVKREPSETDGDGQVSVDESSDSAMLSRPGTSNGSGSTSKGSPWILSADSTGEEMQLTPGQDFKQEMEEKELLKKFILQDAHNISQSEEGRTRTVKKLESCNNLSKQQQKSIIKNLTIYSSNDCNDELIIPDLIETSEHTYQKSQEKVEVVQNNRIRILQPEQLGLICDTKKASDSKDCIEASKIINKNIIMNKSLFEGVHNSPESSKDFSKQYTLVKGINEHHLAAKNFINFSNSITDENNSGSPQDTHRCSNFELNSSTEATDKHNIMGATSSNSIQNVATQFRQILPAQNPQSILSQPGKKEENQITTFNQANTPTVSQLNSQGVSYAFSLGSPLQTSTSSTVNLQVPQFTISTSQIQPTNIVHQPTNSVNIPPQYTFSPSQYQTLTNIVSQPTQGSQNIVVNRPSLFLTPNIVGNSNQTITLPENIKPSVAYIRTGRGFVKRSRRDKIPIRPVTQKKILPKILPKNP